MNENILVYICISVPLIFSQNILPKIVCKSNQISLNKVES